MIYTVTLNPALDRSVVVDQLLSEDTTRILSETPYAAGKGINVSRVIRELGGHGVALGLIGGYEGLQLEGLLINAGVTADFTRISGETRTNIILREQSKDRQYAISATGLEVHATEIGLFYQNVNRIQNMDYLILSGSLPRGLSPNIYGQLILTGKKKGDRSLPGGGRVPYDQRGWAPCFYPPGKARGCPAFHSVVQGPVAHDDLSAFFWGTQVKELNPEMLARFTQIDYDREIALVAIDEDSDTDRLLGVARIIGEPDGQTGEFAVVVGDAWQSRGIGSNLLGKCLSIAEKQGYTMVLGVVLKENQNMLAMGKKLGFDIRRDAEGGDNELVIHFEV